VEYQREFIDLSKLSVLPYATVGQDSKEPVHVAKGSRDSGQLDGQSGQEENQQGMILDSGSYGF
jgi:hypothetical protein